MQAFGALYGNEKVDPPKVKKPRNRDEEIEQEKFNVWFSTFLEPKGYKWFHSPNGGRRNPIEGAKLKRLGVKKGIPDLILPMGRNSYHGLVIELKRVDGKLSDLSFEQKEWLEWFKGQRWSAHVAFGFEHAKRIVLEYLK